MWFQKSRSIIYGKYVLPFLAIILTWIAVGSLFNLLLARNNLCSFTGNVEKIRVEELRFPSRFRNHIDHNLVIRFVDPSNIYVLSEDFKSNFADILRNIHPGDRVSIYFRSLSQTIFGLGRQSDIYQLEKNNIVIFPISTVRRKYILIGLSSFLFAPLVWFGYYLVLKKQKRENPVLNKF